MGVRAERATCWWRASAFWVAFSAATFLRLSSGARVPCSTARRTAYRPGCRLARTVRPLTAHAIADVTKPLVTASAALAVGAAKLCAIALACAGGFPGGIIFPLFFASAAVAHGFAAHARLADAVWVMSLMAATQASVMHALATVFMLGSRRPHCSSPCSCRRSSSPPTRASGSLASSPPKPSLHTSAPTESRSVHVRWPSDDCGIPGRRCKHAHS